MADMNFLDVEPGDQVVLLTGARAVVTHNPGDGLWLIGRYLEHPVRPELVSDKESSIFAHDVQEILPAQELG